MAAFGVHLGTCSACLAVYRDGKTDVVANDLGDRVTPCVVAFTDHDSTVGAAAKQSVVRNAQNTVVHVKRILGRTFDDTVTQEYVALSQVKVLNQNGKPVFEVLFKEKKQKFSPDQITETIYKKMLETAQSHGGSGIQDAVLAVPNDFTPEQRNAASAAAGKAGFNVLRLINEGSAAALAYDLGQLDNTEKFKVLVYRLGGTSHDATVLQVQNGMYRVLGSCFDHSFGADNFTKLLQQHLATEFYRMYKADPNENRRSMAKLLLNAERCKHTLTTLPQAQCAVDSLLDGIDFHTNVSRARFDSQCNTVVGQCTQLIQRALAEACCSKEDITKVVVCGGGTKMPLVQRIISEFLPSSEVLTSIPGDEVIAIGAAKEAAILADREGAELEIAEKENTFRCLSRDIGIETTEGLEVVLAAGTLIPFRTHHIATLGPEQTSFRMVISEAGEGDSTNKLAKVGLDFNIN
ncbi:hypothetical protein V1264_020480 [Littorina saxatilis]|uniref:Heat shock 70 kDa protein 14 n=1 Tax=Littorina saxatilis TaxID=31220 RepID=A0AAN9BBV0_9CAEN